MLILHDNVSEYCKTNDDEFETIFDTYLELSKFSNKDVCFSRRKLEKKSFS